MNAITASTRTGKIARLPSAIRDELNQRLHEGEPQKQLVRWLNDSPLVRERLGKYFQGRPITQQNLSDWKLGGFRDWQRQEAGRGLAHDLFAEAQEVGKELGDAALTDQMADLVALMLMRQLREASEGEAGSEQRQAVLEIARELTRLRRDDHQWRRARRRASGAATAPPEER